MLSNIRRPRYAFGQRDAQPAADGFCEFVRTYRAVRVAHAPKLFGIAKKTRGDVVETVALDDNVFLEQRKIFRRRHEAALEKNNRASVRRLERGGFEIVITARGQKIHCLHLVITLVRRYFGCW